MIEVEFPYIATLVSGGLAFVLGLFWYSPKVLGTRWMEARGKAASVTKSNFKQYVILFFLWLLAACFYSFLVDIIEIDVTAGFFSLSCLLWVAFAMPPLLMGALYTGYAFEAVSIDASYQLAGYYVFAVVHIVFDMMIV